MDLQFSELENGIRLSSLSGELDIKGTGLVETRVAAYCAVDGARVLIDQTDVAFIASIGMRLLMLTDKSVVGRGGRLGLVAPPRSVRDVLEPTGIDNAIPLFDNLADAQAALLAG